MWVYVEKYPIAWKDCCVHCDMTLRPCFSTNQHFLKESNKGSTKEHFYKLFENRPDTFGEEDFLSFNNFFLLVAMETRILDGSKKFKRGHWEAASYEISTKLAKWLGRRSHLKEKVNAGTQDGQFAMTYVWWS